MVATGKSTSRSGCCLAPSSVPSRARSFHPLPQTVERVGPYHHRRIADGRGHSAGLRMQRLDLFRPHARAQSGRLSGYFRHHRRRLGGFAHLQKTARRMVGDSRSELGECLLAFVFGSIVGLLVQRLAVCNTAALPRRHPVQDLSQHQGAFGCDDDSDHWLHRFHQRR